MEKEEFRKISSKKYLLALILTIIVFSIGIAIGIMFENLRLNHSKQDILSEKVGLQSLQLQQKYIDSGLADCNTLHKILETNINELGKKMVQVSGYERRSLFNQEEFNLQLQDYYLTQIQYLLISQEIDKKCPQDDVKIIYFFNENELDTQGSILDYLRKLFNGRVLVFSLDSNFRQEPMIEILLESYEVKEFPSVIVEEKLFSGHTSIKVLKKQICSELFKMDKKKHEEC